MRFPYGLADFRKIREEGYFYVDRTDRIARLEEAGSQLLFLRPRRFGKSLWLSTLENYYDLARADDFDRLFGELVDGVFAIKSNHDFKSHAAHKRFDPTGGNRIVVHDKNRFCL